MSDFDWRNVFEDALRRNPPPSDQAHSARRASDLDSLLRHVDARRRRRIAWRAAAVVVIALGLGILIADRTRNREAISPDPESIATQPDSHPPPRSAPIRIARNDPSLIERLSAHSPHVRILRTVDDVELAGLLRATGHSRGVVRTPDRVLLAADFVASTE